MILRAATTVGCLLFASTVARGGEATRAPLPAPPVFSTHNYELTFAIPPGLFRCPYPTDWVGSDHGVHIYLLKPTDCEPQSPEATGYESDWPSVTVFYAFNVPEVVGRGSAARPPGTTAELLAYNCLPPSKVRMEAVRLLGRKVDLCFRSRRHKIMLEALSLYEQSANFANALHVPSSQLSLTLHTTDRRYDEDFRRFLSIAGTLRVCTAAGEPLAPTRPPCPPHEQW